MDEWFCRVHRHIMLVKKWYKGKNTLDRMSLLITHTAYCPECSRMQMSAIKARGLDQAINNPRPFRGVERRRALADEP